MAGATSFKIFTVVAIVAGSTYFANMRSQSDKETKLTIKEEQVKTRQEVVK